MTWMVLGLRSGGTLISTLPRSMPTAWASAHASTRKVARITLTGPIDDGASGRLSGPTETCIKAERRAEAWPLKKELTTLDLIPRQNPNRRYDSCHKDRICAPLQAKGLRR